MNINKEIIKRAKEKNKTIVFPEASFSDRISKAGIKIAKMGLAKVIFIGDESSMSLQLKKNDLKYVTVYNPKTFEHKQKIIEHIFEKRKHKGMTIEEATSLADDPIYFATALTTMGYADGMICGAEVPTANTLRPALQIIGTKEGLCSSYFLMLGKNRVTDDVFMMGDCAVVEDPTYEQLTAIAELILEENKKFNLFNPRFAFLSYSTYGSAFSPSTEKVSKAYQLFINRNPEIKAVGEAQFDASVSKRVASVKMAGREQSIPANVFIMPNIDAGNICYKAIQYFGHLKAIGPITVGLKKPVNDLSRGCTIKEIITLTAITVLQCEDKKEE